MASTPSTAIFTTSRGRRSTENFGTTDTTTKCHTTWVGARRISPPGCPTTDSRPERRRCHLYTQNYMGPSSTVVMDSKNRLCSLIWRVDMPFHPAFQPLVALIAGILILIMPRLLNYVVAIYLIIIGILGLLPRPCKDQTPTCLRLPDKKGQLPREYICQPLDVCFHHIHLCHLVPREIAVVRGFVAGR